MSDTPSLIELLREEAEFHCVSSGQGFSSTDVAEERALMTLLNRAADELAASLKAKAAVEQAYIALAFAGIRSNTLSEGIEELRKAKDEAERDAQRLDWLSVPGRSCGIQERDQIMSMHFKRKSVHYYINGRYTTVDGDTLRAAISEAMKKGEK